MEFFQLSKASLAVALLVLSASLGFSTLVSAEEKRDSLTFTKANSATQWDAWQKKVATGPARQRQNPPKPKAESPVQPLDAPAPATTGVVTKPSGRRQSLPEAGVVPGPTGVKPDTKVETDYHSLRRELTDLRPLDPGDKNLPATASVVPPREQTAVANHSTASADPMPALKPEKSAAQPKPAPFKAENGPVQIPISTRSSTTPNPASESVSPIGSPGKPAEDLRSPGRQTQASPNRGIFQWFKREREQQPEVSDSSMVIPISNPSGSGEANVIAEYPPKKMADTGGPDAGGNAHSASVSPATNSPPPQKSRGLFSRLFGKKSNPDTGGDPADETFGETTLDRFPKLEEIRVKASKAEFEIDGVVQQIQGEYENRIERMTATDLTLPSKTDGTIVPRDLESAWFDGMLNNLWKNEERIAVPLRETYARALMNSNQVRVVSYIPLIGETGIGEAEGQFDPEFFMAGRRAVTDRPTNSELDTGSIGRFTEQDNAAEAGIRKRFASTGGQLALSNRFSSLKNNSEFTIPNPQTSSDLILSVRQPLLRGAGYHYNKATLKIAKLEANSAAGEYIRLLESHLLEVNRAYWGVYLARAAFLLRKSLVNQTAEIVERIESRADEATASELLRARSELSKRRTGLNRAEMGVRNAEERLRSLINDPEFPIGGNGEFIPMTRPVLSPPKENVKGAAREAVDNRTEIAQSFNQLRSTAIIEEAGRSELRPQLDLLGEMSYAGIAPDRGAGEAYSDMFRHGTGWMGGLEFSQPWERNFAKARQRRRTYEFLQQADSVRQTIDTVLLESVVTFREVMTAYRDMQGRYQEVVLTREEVQALNKRLEVDVNKNTIAFQLQLIMDAIERNQIAEEQFLVSIVSYNIAFAALDRAKGTFLTYHDVAMKRVSDQINGKGLESIKASSPSSPGAPEQSRTK